MSRCFTDPGKAEESFQILDQLKDANVWRILTVLLDPNCNSIRASSSRVRRNLFEYNVGSHLFVYRYIKATEMPRYV